MAHGPGQMFETMEIVNPTSLFLILTPCDLIVKNKNLLKKPPNEIKKKSMRSKRLKFKKIFLPIDF
jgi:hypothetical protein